MNDDQLRQEIEQLTERLRRIEKYIGIDLEARGGASHEVMHAANASRAAQEAAASKAAAPPAVGLATALKDRKAVAHAAAGAQAHAAAPPSAPPIAPSPKTTAAPPVPVAAAPPFAPPRVTSQPAHTTPPQTPPPSQPPRAPARPQPQRPGNSLETTIGIKVLGGVGAIIVVLGAAFAAREYGTAFWLTLPPSVQALFIAMFGGALVLGGELALRKLGKPASLGLYGAGLGVLYMDAFATFQWFQIVSREASFLLMGLVAIGGFAITLRTRFLSIGVLSLIGGYITPILLWRLDPGGVQIFAYLTMLTGIALALSAWQPRPYRPLRYVAFSGVCSLGLITVIASAQAQPMTVLVFISMWWTMFKAEAVFAAMRRQSPVGNVAISLLSTAAYVTCASSILQWFMPAGDQYLGVFTAMIGVLCAAAALQFGPGLDALRSGLVSAPGNSIDKLAVALWAQCGVLIALAIAMQFDGYGASVGWLALALAAVEIGRRLPSAGVTIFGLIVLGLAIFRVAFVDSWSGALNAELWSTAGLMIDHWSILGLIAVLALFAAGKRIGGRVSDDAALNSAMPALLTLAGAMGWFALIGRQAEGLTLTALWLAGPIIMLALERFNRRERHLEIALMMLLVAAVKWLLVDGFSIRLDAAWNPADFMVILNPQMALAAVIAAAGWWGMNRGPASLRPFAPVAGSLILLCALGFEVERLVSRFIVDETTYAAWPPAQLRALWITAMLAAGGLLMVLSGTWRSVRELALAGWGITFAAAVACLLYGVLTWRFDAGPQNVPVVLNVQFGIGLLMIGALAVLVRFGRDAIRQDEGQAYAVVFALALAAVFAFVIGSLEIDRGWADNVMAKQMGLSIYWALYGVALVLVGFVKLSAPSRYVGLALLALVVAKVLIIDMATVDQVWRVLSLIVSGLLLIGTSMAYAKLTPGLLESLKSRASAGA